MNKRQTRRFLHFDVVDRYELDGRKMIERGRILDISEGGLLCKWFNPLTPGNRFMFRFELGGEVFFVEGEITRLAWNPVDEKPLSGVKLALTKEQQDRVALLLSRSGKKPVA
jgi:hypothetical protein